MSVYQYLALQAVHSFLVVVFISSLVFVFVRGVQTLNKGDSFDSSTATAEDRAAMVPYYTRIYVAISASLVSLAFLRMVPTVQDIRDAYVTQEAGKLVSAENVKIVAEEISKRVDKALAK